MPGYPSWQGMSGFSPGQGRPGFPPGQGIPGFPPGQGGPGFPPGQGRPDFPPGQQGGSQPPRSAPPSTTPTYPSTQLFAVDPGAIRGCLYRFTFIWLSRRQGFWFLPVFVGRRSVAGWRWRSRQRRWVYMGIDLDNIDRFSCY
nr:transporter [Sporosarcina jiandibaonis]